MAWAWGENGLMTTEPITFLLRAAQQGDIAAKNLFFSSVYDELRNIAAGLLARESADQMLHPSALVHESYLQLFPIPENAPSQLPTLWPDRQAFFDAAASSMRQILIDARRRKTRLKRGGDFCRVLIDLDKISMPETTGQLLALDEALCALDTLEPKMAEVVRLRFFAGMTVGEVANQMGIGRRTADGYWAYAKAWLMAEMSDTQTQAKNRAS
jgi:RNA polymerase sigma factor (TIGR02999 family)